MKRRLVDRLRDAGQLGRALSAILGTEVDETKTTRIRCIHPENHKHGDKNPSMIVKPDAGRVDCACGAAYGLLQLGVAKGYASNPALVALRIQKEVLGEFGGDAPAGNGRPQPRKTYADRLTPAIDDLHDRDDWARLAETTGLAPNALKRAFGGVEYDDGKPVRLLLPIWSPDGRVVGLKQRPGGKDLKTRNHGVAGLLNLHRLKDLPEGGIAVVVEGESDMLALQELADDEGLPVVVLSPSNGAGQDLAPFAPALAGRDVAVCYDEDDAGKKAAEKAVAALKKQAHEIRRVRLPFEPEQLEAGRKDLRDWLEIRSSPIAKPRTARDFLDLTEEARPEHEKDRAELAQSVERVRDILEEPDPPQAWVIDTVLEAMCTMLLFGPSYSGKSLIAWYAALCLARGHGFVLNRTIRCDPVPSIIFYGENSRKQLKNAIRKQLAGETCPAPLWAVDVLAVGPFPDLGTPKGQEWYEAIIRAYRPGLCVADNTTSLVMADRAKGETATNVMRFLSRMSKRYGVSWILVHHTRKASSKGDEASYADRSYGGHEWNSFADASFFIEPEKNATARSTKRYVRPIKVRDAVTDEDYLVDLDRDTLRFNYIGPLGGLGAAGTGKKITPYMVLKTIHDENRIITLQEVADALECSIRTVRNRVNSDEFKRLFERGTIEVVERRSGGVLSVRMAGPLPVESEV